jgi:hypothetical protein
MAKSVTAAIMMMHSMTIPTAVAAIFTQGLIKRFHASPRSAYTVMTVNYSKELKDLYTDRKEILKYLPTFVPHRNNSCVGNLTSILCGRNGSQELP